MAASTEPNRVPKLPQESASTTNPSFAHQNIQTAPDVATSQKVAGTAPSPNLPLNNPPPAAGLGVSVPNAGGSHPMTPGASPNISQQTLEPAKPAAGAENAQTTPTAPSPASPETSNYQAPPTPTTPVQAGGQGTVQAPGAPPGVPNTTPVVPVPVAPPPKAIEGKNAAEDEWLQSQAENQQKLYEAALGYNGGPTSALAQDQLKAGEGVRTATNARGAAGTINSSLFAGDKSRIATAKATADTTAYNNYLKATTEANDALEKARAAWVRAGENERREIAEAAEHRQSKDPVYTGVGAQTQGLAPSNIQVYGPAGPGGVVPRSYKSGSGTVTIGGRRK